MLLEGKVAVITGGGRGIGRAIAIEVRRARRSGRRGGAKRIGGSKKWLPPSANPAGAGSRDSGRRVARSGLRKNRARNPARIRLRFTFW